MPYSSVVSRPMRSQYLKGSQPLANERAGLWCQGILADVQRVKNSEPKLDEKLERFLAEYEEYKKQNTDNVELLGINQGQNNI